VSRLESAALDYQSVKFKWCQTQGAGGMYCVKLSDDINQPVSEKLFINR